MTNIFIPSSHNTYTCIHDQREEHKPRLHLGQQPDKRRTAPFRPAEMMKIERSTKNEYFLMATAGLGKSDRNRVASNARQSLNS